MISLSWWNFFITIHTSIANSPWHWSSILRHSILLSNSRVLSIEILIRSSMGVILIIQVTSRILWCISIVWILSYSIDILANHGWILTSQWAQKCYCLICICKLLSQDFHLSFEVFNLAQFGIVILNRLIWDEGSLWSITQCREVFLNLGITWIETCKHESITVTS